MPPHRWFDESAERSPSQGGGSIAGAPGVLGLRVSREQWSQAAEDFAGDHGRLLSLWAGRDERGGELLRAAFIAQARVLVVCLPLTAADPPFPGIDHLFPCAGRMQRAVADLCGLRAANADSRPWLRHAAWPEGFHPLVDEQPTPAREPAADDYPFVAVEGEGVHEIAVGPVHAGIIEPGHFRFSVVGEKVLRLEARLGYTHKGIAKRFESLPQNEAHRLAARISGDTAVAFAWAYCAALESITATTIPARALQLRALALEHERLANHLGDLGALGNDAGFAFGLTQFSRLKEDLLRANVEAFGTRYLFDYISPGGVARDFPQQSYAHLI